MKISGYSNANLYAKTGSRTGDPEVLKPKDLLVKNYTKPVEVSIGKVYKGKTENGEKYSVSINRNSNGDVLVNYFSYIEIPIGQRETSVTFNLRNGQIYHTVKSVHNDEFEMSMDRTLMPSLVMPGDEEYGKVASHSMIKLERAVKDHPELKSVTEYLAFTLDRR